MSARLAGILRERGQSAIIVEREADNPLVSVLRSLGHHVLVADATKEQTLRLAGADRARSLLVLTSQDARNLHIALMARGLSQATGWARIDTSLRAHHVTTNSAIRAGSPLLMAARAFGDAPQRGAACLRDAHSVGSSMPGDVQECRR